jgi:hypothetical protein
MRYVVHWDGCNLQGRAGQGRAGMVFARKRRRKEEKEGAPAAGSRGVVWREG